MSWPTTTRGFAASNRLAEISRRHMEQFRAPPPAAEPPRTETHQPEPEDKEDEDMEVHTNGVGKRADGRRRYTDEFKAEVLERFEVADNKREFAKDEGLNIGMLSRWRAEAKEKGAPSRELSRAKPPPPPPSPARQPPNDFARELDVLRQLLELPAAARDRLVGYLAAADR